MNIRICWLCSYTSAFALFPFCACLNPLWCIILVFLSSHVSIFPWGSLLFSGRWHLACFSLWCSHLLTPYRRAKGKSHYPTAGLFSASLKMNKKNFFFSFRNCKKWCKKAQNAIISLSFPSYVNWQPPENRQCIGERASWEVAKRGFGSPQAVLYEWIWLGIVLPYADHLFSMTQTLLPHFCSNEAREMVLCL